MTNQVPVSVVIPCHQHAGVLGRAITSVINQTVLPLEIIVVVDGPSDEINLFLNSQPLEVQNYLEIIALPINVGAGEARNIGWNRARGEYVAFLDSDDAWHPKKLETQHKFMQENPDILITGHCHRIENHDPDWSSYDLQVPEVRKVFSLLRLLIVNPIITPSVMISKKCRQRFCSNFRFMEDYQLWLAIVANGGNLVRLNSELACIFKPAFGSSGLSSHLWQMEKGELRAYFSIAKENFLVALLLPGLLVYSLIKFLRRLVIVSFNLAKI
jgi:glycosyltransferase involved in cell wall biosynthesis